MGYLKVGVRKRKVMELYTTELFAFWQWACITLILWKTQKILSSSLAEKKEKKRSYIKKNVQRHCDSVRTLYFSVSHRTVTLALSSFDKNVWKVFQIITSFYVAWHSMTLKMNDDISSRQRLWLQVEWETASQEPTNS